HNPDAVFMNTAAEEGIFAFQNLPRDAIWYLGAPDWAPEVYFLFGNDFADAVGKIQRLQGTTPLPPLWALGHHQSRWGYRSPADAKRISQEFRRHRIPNDAVWLDIDYMDGYRV